MNPMKTIRIAKITLNFAVGSDQQKLDKGKKIIKSITGKDPVIVKTKKRNTFGVTKGRPISAKITLRGNHAAEVLKTVIKALENRLKPSQFNDSGFSFGVAEYINIPGIKYDPDIGILGFDVAVTLERPGYRVSRRRLKPAPVGAKHRITRQEAIEWAMSFGINVSGEE